MSLRLFCSCFIFCLPKGSWNRWRDTYSHHRDEIRGRSTRHQRRICQIISLLTGQVYIGESVFVVVVRSFLCLLVYCAQEYIPQWKSQSEILRKTDPQGRVPHCGSSLLGLLRFVILQSSGHRTAVYSAFNEVLNSFLIVIFNLDFSCKFVSLHWTLFHWSGDGEAHSQCQWRLWTPLLLSQALPLISKLKRTSLSVFRTIHVEITRKYFFSWSVKRSEQI